MCVNWLNKWCQFDGEVSITRMNWVSLSPGNRWYSFWRWLRWDHEWHRDKVQSSNLLSFFMVSASHTSSPSSFLLLSNRFRWANFISVTPLLCYCQFGPLDKNGLLSSSRVFSFGQLGSIALKVKLLLGSCEKSWSIGVKGRCLSTLDLSWLTQQYY